MPSIILWISKAIVSNFLPISFSAGIPGNWGSSFEPGSAPVTVPEICDNTITLSSWIILALFSALKSGMSWEKFTGVRLRKKGKSYKSGAHLSKWWAWHSISFLPNPFD